MLRVAIVGGGLFGCTAAILAARSGLDVHLFEAKPVLMSGATASTYSRLHRGYHYPRSGPTGRESRAAEASFRSEYGSAVIDGGRQFYIVPPSSKVSVDQYRDFLDDESMPFSEDGGVFQVHEPRLHLGALQSLVRQKVNDAGIRVHPGTEAKADIRQHFDQIIVACYAGMNRVLTELGFVPQAYKYQVVERPIALLPPSFRDTSIVVVDGPFGCIDPLDDTPLHVLGHVVHTIHAETTGAWPAIPKHLTNLIDKGFVSDPPVTRFREVVDDLARFIPGIGEARYVGSSFTLRAVLANVERTDERPTITERLDAQVTRIFSGKLGTCVTAAQAACDSLVPEQGRASDEQPAQVQRRRIAAHA